jgi:hypothetical protein
MEVKILIIEGQKAEVRFKGMWTRKFIDIAYKNMLLNLPIHMAKIKQQDIASKQAERKEAQNE